MVGKNKGKKYIKLKGHEVATPENEARAQKFLIWYGRMSEYIQLRLINPKVYDDEVATDTVIMIYDNIALKGFKVDNFKWYFLIAYRSNYIAARTKAGASLKNIVYLEEAPAELSANDFNYAQFEMSVDSIKNEMLEYVRRNYAPIEVSLFEIYIGLLPHTSYARMSVMLGYSREKISTAITAIRKDLALKYRGKYEFLLSSI